MIREYDAYIKVAEDVVIPDEVTKPESVAK